MGTQSARPGHPGVAGGAVDVLDQGALPDLPDERMLTAAIPDDQDLHPRVSFLRSGIRKVCHAAEKGVKPRRPRPDARWWPAGATFLPFRHAISMRRFPWAFAALNLAVICFHVNLFGGWNQLSRALPLLSLIEEGTLRIDARPRAHGRQGPHRRSLLLGQGAGDDAFSPSPSMPSRAPPSRARATPRTGRGRLFEPRAGRRHRHRDPRLLRPALPGHPPPLRLPAGGAGRTGRRRLAAPGGRLAPLRHLRLRLRRLLLRPHAGRAPPARSPISPSWSGERRSSPGLALGAAFLTDYPSLVVLGVWGLQCLWRAPDAAGRCCSALGALPGIAASLALQRAAHRHPLTPGLQVRQPPRVRAPDPRLRLRRPEPGGSLGARLRPGPRPAVPRPGAPRLPDRDAPWPASSAVKRLGRLARPRAPRRLSRSSSRPSTCGRADPATARASWSRWPSSSCTALGQRLVARARLSRASCSPSPGAPVWP